jgi:hypothetical protein
MISNDLHILLNPRLWVHKGRLPVTRRLRNLKMFFGLVTSLPRSANGYFANYIYSILAYVMCA